MIATDRKSEVRSQKSEVIFCCSFSSVLLMSEPVVSQAKSWGFICQLNDSSDWQIFPRQPKPTWKLGSYLKLTLGGFSASAMSLKFICLRRRRLVFSSAATLLGTSKSFPGGEPVSGDHATAIGQLGPLPLYLLVVPQFNPIDGRDERGVTRRWSLNYVCVALFFLWVIERFVFCHRKGSSSSPGLDRNSC